MYTVNFTNHCSLLYHLRTFHSEPTYKYAKPFTHENQSRDSEKDEK